MRETIAGALKEALKSQDKRRTSTLRLIQAAIQDRDIANRGAGKDPVSGDDILQILAKMVKQREESAKAFEDGQRPELAAQERDEIEIIRGLRGHTTGYAVPQLVIDAPGGGGKVPINPDYVERVTDDEIVFRNYEGREFRYPLNGAASGEVPADAATRELPA